MKKYIPTSLLFLALTFLTGCTSIGERTSSISVIYFVSALLSFILLLGCIVTLKKKEPWMLVLFSCVLIINCGYYALSVSDTLAAALWANRVAYLGSTLLPLATLMVILKVSGIKAPRWLPYVLLVVAAGVFFIAASPGILDIYYKSVELGSYNGATVLEKTYGPLHPLNLFYLLGYTVVTAVVAVNTALKKKFRSNMQTLVLVASVFCNIGVWLLEQFVKIDFELLSVSYIISELFLLCLFLIDNEQSPVPSPSDTLATSATEKAEEKKPALSEKDEAIVIFKEGLLRLTPTEKIIYGYYLEQKTTKEIMATLSITENTLKYHNKNIYSKLGVSSRKQLFEIAKNMDK